METPVPPSLKASTLVGALGTAMPQSTTSQAWLVPPVSKSKMETLLGRGRERKNSEAMDLGLSVTRRKRLDGIRGAQQKASKATLISQPACIVSRFAVPIPP